MLSAEQLKIILESGMTVTAIDNESAPRIFRAAFRRKKDSDRITVADYTSEDNGRTWKLSSIDNAYEMRLDDCIKSIQRLESSGCNVEVKEK